MSVTIPDRVVEAAARAMWPDLHLKQWDTAMRLALEAALAEWEAMTDRDKFYEAAFRKADELGWEGEEQFTGELVEIVDAVLVASPEEEGWPIGAERAALQMHDRLLFDEWKPHAPPEFPEEGETLRGRMFRIFDEAYDLLVDDGIESGEAVTTVRVMFGSGR